MYSNKSVNIEDKMKDMLSKCITLPQTMKNMLMMKTIEDVDDNKILKLDGE